MLLYFIIVLRKEDSAIASEGCRRPLIGDEAPVMAYAWLDTAFAPDEVDEVIAQIVVGGSYDAIGELGQGYAGALGQQLSAAIAAIAVDGYEIFLVLGEWRAVLHGEDSDFLSVGLGGIDGIVDAGSRIEVEGHILQPQALAAIKDIIHEQYVIVGRSHCVAPMVVAHLKEVAYFAPSETHRIEEVLVLVKCKHVGDMRHASLNGCIEGEGGGKGDLRPLAELELEVVDEVHKRRWAEEGIAFVDGGGKSADLLVHVSLDGLACLGEPCRRCKAGKHAVSGN